MSDVPVAVVALGGNALLRPDMTGERAELVRSAEDVAAQIATLIREGWRVLVVHGNGPQVGVELIRSEEASTKVPPFGLDLCVASTQGSMATLLEVALRNALMADNLDVPVASVISLVEVASDDAAFGAPEKPIGPFYSAYRLRQLKESVREKGWDVIEDAGRGYRTVVPSPRPQRILASPAARVLLEAGYLVIAGGGGGVPVSQMDAGGRLETREAVIDKDRTATLLAADVGADVLLFLTAVPWVELNHGTPFAKPLRNISPDELRRHFAGGHFPPGSMGPKVLAACQFADSGGTAIITSADALADAIAGRAGTRVTKSKAED